VVIDAGPKNTTKEDTLTSERRSTLKKPLTEPTLLEMSGYPTNQVQPAQARFSGSLVHSVAVTLAKVSQVVVRLGICAVNI